MKTYVYPAILTEDADERYYISIPDLSLQTIGDSKEDAFVRFYDYVIEQSSLKVTVSKEAQ